MRRSTLVTAGGLAALLGTAMPATAARHAPKPAASDAATALPAPGAIAPSRALYLNLITDMRQSGRIHAALAHLDAFDKLYPRAVDAAILRGDCLVDIAAYDEAIAVYRRQLKSPLAAAAYAGLGRIEALNERWASAASAFAEAVSRAPTMPKYLNDYGFALLQDGEPAQALFRIKQAAELAPGDPRVRNNLILALAATGDTAGAQQLLASITDRGERAEIAAAMTTRATTRPVQAAAVDPFR